MRGKAVWVVTAISAAFLMGGCAKVPEKEMKDAKKAVEAASTAEAEIFTPELYGAVNESLRAGLAEIEKQNAKSKIIRTYDKAKSTLLAVIASAKEAEKTAVRKKEEIKPAAQALVEQASKALEEAKAILEKLAKKTKKDIKTALENEVKSVETELSEARSAFDGGNIAAAHEKGTSAIGRANALLAHIKAEAEKKSQSKSQKAGRKSKR